MLRSIAGATVTSGGGMTGWGLYRALG